MQGLEEVVVRVCVRACVSVSVCVFGEYKTCEVYVVPSASFYIPQELTADPLISDNFYGL